MIKRENIEAVIKEMTLDEKLSLCTGKNSWQTKNIDRLGIPSVTMSDGTNGVRFQKGSVAEKKETFCERIKSDFDSSEAIENTYPATCFPTGSAIACSWDRELIGEAGKAIAKECRALGIDLLLGPGINTRRHPLTARNYEYYSEDPCLAGEMAAAIIEGIQAEGVGTSIKHFACHNSDSFRTRVDVRVDEQALREIYLACFERAIKKAHPLTVMSAYNQVNGVEASGNTPLVRDILKKEWEYDGAVICDWGAVKNPIEASKGGIDLQMPCCEGSLIRLKKAVEQGELEESLIDERVRRILTLVCRLQEMKREPEPVDFEAQHALAARAAEESAVLLKNEDGILPLDRRTLKKIAVVGRLAKEPVFQGSGCAIVHAVTVDEPLACIKNCCDCGTEVVYADGYDGEDTATRESLEEAAEAARDADAVVVFVGNRCPGETDDYNRRDILIEEGHQKLLETVAAVNSRVITVLASGEVVEMPWLGKTKGLLAMWYGGEGAGMAAARLLFGEANPCGRLSATIPVKLSDTPAHLGFANHVFDMDYSEGVYVGYRYYDKKELEPAFPFGFGLSYTDFAYSSFRLSAQEADCPEQLSQIEVSAAVTNTGSRAGGEVVQLYIAQQNPMCPRPVRELKGFEKIWLEPGETKVVTFRLCERDFAYYDTKAQAFVVDADTFFVEIGRSSRDICLRESLTVHKTNRPRLKLRMDCGFTELFEDPEDMAAFDRFLEENGVIKPGDGDEKMHQRMINSFWPVSSYLDMNAGAEITWEMFEDFINERNQTRG